jgi:16S rRNA (guanine527-N7)-methyltransferase
VVTASPALTAVLEESQRLGFLGPGSVAAHVEHALGFARPGTVAAPRSFLDLGSGGGVPGLVLATLVWPVVSVVLLDAAQRRCDFLRTAVGELALGDRVTVRRGRAEEAGRDPSLRGRFDLVVSRSFAAPSVTAECAAPFLRMGGQLVVSEPPEEGQGDSAGSRWPTGPLAELGLVPVARWATPFHFQSFRQAHPCPDRYPRRVGVPAKRPLF